MDLLLGSLFGLFLAYANGSNDNFKGVATLFGSGTANFKKALAWACLTTAAGSIAALLIAQGLLASFSGKGLVPDSVVALKSFGLAVGLASASTVMLATRLGFPISTTHALIGALVGAGVFASPNGIHSEKLISHFVVPLLVSPLIAIVGAMALYPVFRWIRVRFAIEKETCVCIGTEVVGIVPQARTSPEAAALLSHALTLPTLQTGTTAQCLERYSGTFFGIEARPALDVLHYASSGAVSFARGLNDTPKIAAILLAGASFSASFAIASVTVAMAAGGWLSAKRVAETVSHRITAMNAGQGFTANLVTSVLVLFASKLGLPVSTTHVSCGALFGLGAVTGQARWRTIFTIALAWVTTLPVAALLGMVFFQVGRRIFA